MLQRWRGALKEAIVGGAAGAGIVLAFAAAGVTNLEDLDHLGSFTVALLTIPLVALSYVLFQETRALRLENSAPRLVLTIEPGRYFGFFDVVIANVGRGTAFSVETTLDPDIIIHENGDDPTNLSENRFISPPVIKPEQEFRLYIGRLEELSPHLTQVRCRYKNERGAECTDTNMIDLRMYEKFGQLGPDNYLHEIAKHVEAVSRTLGKITSTSRLRVDTYDEADRAAEMDRRTQQRRVFRARNSPPEAPEEPSKP